MKGRPIDALVYEQLFKTPKPSDCQNFAALLQRQLVPEVRLETAAFYGNLDTKEAQYPGLDYSHPPHRMRLSRFPWHRRLFRAFDTLGLTKAEIASLTKWEGTRWAKERFEKEQGMKIIDTTGQEIKAWAGPGARDEVADGPEEEPALEERVAEGDADETRDGEEEESDVDSVELNERLRARAAAHYDRSFLEATSVGTMDEQWEQWMKELSEANENDLASLPTPPPVPSSSRPPHAHEGRRETYAPPPAPRQPDGHQPPAHPRTSTAPTNSHIIPSSSSSSPSSSTSVPHRHAHDLATIRFPVSTPQPRQAQPSRS